MSVNKVILLGHLGADPEMRYTQSGTAVGNLRIATNETWTDKSGQRQERTEWHRVVTFGRTAENVGKYLKKGRQIYVEGRLQTRDWEDRDGNKRYTTEIVASNITFLGGGGKGAGGGFDGPPAYTDDDIGMAAAGGGGGGFDQSFDDDEIPF